MFELKRAVKAAVTSSMPTLTIVSSSWRSVRKQYPLPALVIDMDHVTPKVLTEDGQIVSRQHDLQLSLHVPLVNVSDEDAELALEALMDQLDGVFQATFGGNYSILDWYPMNVPWGTAQALAGAFTISIEA